MTLSGVTLIFEAVFAALLVVTIVCAVKLNARISGLRARDGELREMIGEFDRASSQARESAAALKSAGTEAERQLSAVIERAQALRDDLTFMVAHGERIAHRIEQPHGRTQRSRETAGDTQPAGPAAAPSESAPPADGGGKRDDARRYRSEVERALADVIRSTATAG